MTKNAKLDARKNALIASRTTADLIDMARKLEGDKRDGSFEAQGWILDELCDRSEIPGSGITVDGFIALCAELEAMMDAAG